MEISSKNVSLEEFSLQLYDRGDITSNCVIVLLEVAYKGIKQISKELIFGNLLNSAKVLGQKNVSGDDVKGLDVLANGLFLEACESSKKVGYMISEENELPQMLPASAEYDHFTLVVDPLDGSNNIDVNGLTGSIFGIFDKSIYHTPVVAGYAVYSASTELVIALKDGVYCFVSDPASGKFILTRSSITIPEKGLTYSVNMGHFYEFNKKTQSFIDLIQKNPDGKDRYSLKYTGCLAADFHRVLLKGGVFLYPATAKNPQGKLKLLYEAKPLAFIVEKANGKAINGNGLISRIPITDIHMRTPLIIGSNYEIERYLACS